ncbi:MAG TPA: hypothetical protein VNN98_06600, partial [Rhizomicrobium sp.]|nr:hypothetical protein [Rhizomicrobium sp.]
QASGRAETPAPFQARGNDIPVSAFPRRSQVGIIRRRIIITFDIIAVMNAAEMYLEICYHMLPAINSDVCPACNATEGNYLR